MEESDPFDQVIDKVDRHFAVTIGHKICFSIMVEGGTYTVELDSQVDSPVVGSNTYALENSGKKVTDSGFTDALGKFLLFDMVHALVEYDCK